MDLTNRVPGESSFLASSLDLNMVGREGSLAPSLQNDFSSHESPTS